MQVWTTLRAIYASGTQPAGRAPGGIDPGYSGNQRRAISAPAPLSISGATSPSVSSTRSVRADLQVGGVGALAADHAVLGEPVDVIEERGQPGEVLGQARRGDPVVLPGRVDEADRVVGPGRIERPGSAVGPHRLGAEVHRPPREPAAEVLELRVAPALGLTHGVGDRLRVQRRFGLELLEPLEDRPRAVHRLAVDHRAGDGAVALAVDPHHLGVVGARRPGRRARTRAP